MTNIGIVGAGNGGTSILKSLQGIKTIKVVGICDLNEYAPGIALAKSLGIKTFSRIEDMVSLPALDLLIEATGIARVQELIELHKGNNVFVIDSQGANLMMTIVEAREEMIAGLHQEAEKLAGMSTEMSNTMEAVSKLVEEVSEYANGVNIKVSGLLQSADEAVVHLKATGQVLNIINSISQQTKLLGFNAAIEAAHSGEHGRGFAVVADEIRKLAEDSTNSVKKISDILSDIQESVEVITGGVNEAAKGIQMQNQLTGSVAEKICSLGNLSQNLDVLAQGLARLA